MTDQEVRLDWTERNARLIDGQPNTQRSAVFQFGKKHIPQPAKNLIKSVAWKVGLMRKAQIRDFNRLLPPDQRTS